MMDIRIELKTVYKNTRSPLKATAIAVLDECFVVRDIRLIERGERLFVSFPTFRGRDSKWRNVCNPVNPEFRKKFENEVIKAYQEA